MQQRLPALVAISAAVGVAAVGLLRGTWAVGGSDSSCYALMAAAFADGVLQPTSLFPSDAPWPDVGRTLAPAGFIPSPVRALSASPICSPGFSLLAAPLVAVAGRDALFVVSPIAGAWLVWLAFVLASRLAGPWAGAAGAALVATMPVVLFQVVQPMNDVAVGAVWMAVVVASFTWSPSRPWLMGGLAGLALLIRPNLAPAWAVAALWLAWITWRGDDVRDTRARRFDRTRRALLAFTVATSPCVLILLFLNAELYGHPLQSGYGTPMDLFSVASVGVNVQQYASVLWHTQLGVPLLGVMAAFSRRDHRRSTAWLVIGLAVATATVYVLYRPFPEWWYFRFFLPALAPLTALSAALLLPSGAPLPIARILVVMALGTYQLAAARDGQAFDLQRLERRFRTTAHAVASRLPPTAVFLSVWESGSLRYHAERPSILWDSLDPASLDTAIAWLQSRGLDAFIVLESWEEPSFRARFAPHSPIGQLDWPPRFEIERQVRIYDPSDRATFVTGGRIATEYVYEP